MNLVTLISWITRKALLAVSLIDPERQSSLGRHDACSSNLYYNLWRNELMPSS
jgi:hypothetical protein